MLPTKLSRVLCVLALLASACGSSGSTTTAVDAGFLLDARRDAGIDGNCIDQADDFLVALSAYFSALGEMSLDEFLTEGLFYVEDNEPELAAGMAEATRAYLDSACPAGYLSASIVAHADQFDLAGPGAAIWWASTVVGAADTIGSGAESEEQARRWLDFIGSTNTDISERAVPPSPVALDAISDCEALVVATNNLFQQQLYYISTVPFLAESAEDPVAPLEEATSRLQARIDALECDGLEMRLAFLRVAHDYDVAGPSAVLALAGEIANIYQIVLDNTVSIDVSADAIPGATENEVTVIVRNEGNASIRLLSVEFGGELRDGLAVKVAPGGSTAVALTFPGEAPRSGTVEVTAQGPVGGDQTASFDVSVE